MFTSDTLVAVTCCVWWQQAPDEGLQRHLSARCEADVPDRWARSAMDSDESFNFYNPVTSGLQLPQPPSSMSVRIPQLLCVRGVADGCVLPIAQLDHCCKTFVKAIRQSSWSAGHDSVVRPA